MDSSSKFAKDAEQALTMVKHCKKSQTKKSKKQIQAEITALKNSIDECTNSRLLAFPL